MSDAVSPTELLNSGEDVTDIVTESQDYVPYELLEPTHGDVKYISKSRETKVSRRNIKTGDRRGEPFLSIELVTSELEDPSGETITLGRPIRTWINTIQFSQRNRPGTTSSASSYLLEAGFSPKDLTGSDLVEALGEAANIPLEAIVGWTNRGVKDPETGEWSEEFAVTKDFNRGTKEEPNYVAEYEDDERGTVKAKHRIVAFRKV
jgi:hypothetical protein